MKKITSIFVILFLLTAAGIILSSLKQEEKSERTIEYIEKKEALRVLDGEEVIFEYTIGEFREWAKEEWSKIFTTPPSFGEIREVDPENFYWFDSTAALSPRADFLVFSVNDYAVLTNISFIGVVNLENKEVRLVGKENIGGVQNLYWSPCGTYVAYILDTARARGDFLSVDNTEKMDKEFTLSGDDILNAIIKQEEHQSRPYLQFMPNFREVNWTDEGKRIEFASDDYEGVYDGIRWSINPQGGELKKEGVVRSEPVDN